MKMCKNIESENSKYMFVLSTLLIVYVYTWLLIECIIYIKHKVIS